jgi:hypothetical protein
MANENQNTDGAQVENGEQNQQQGPAQITNVVVEADSAKPLDYLAGLVSDETLKKLNDDKKQGAQNSQQVQNQQPAQQNGQQEAKKADDANEENR